jgi:hypothetical protein
VAPPHERDHPSDERGRFSGPRRRADEKVGLFVETVERGYAILLPGADALAYLLVGEAFFA